MVTVMRARTVWRELGTRSRLALAAALVVGALAVPAGVHAATRHAAQPAVATESVSAAALPPLVDQGHASAPDTLSTDALETSEPAAGPEALAALESAALAEITHPALLEPHREEAAAIAVPTVHAIPAPAIAAPATLQLQRAQIAAPAPAFQAQDATAPVQAVTAFYTAIAQRRLDGALQTWSPRMRAAYPPGVYLYDRFAGTSQMIVRSAVLTSMDAAAGRATVAVELTESSSVAAFNRSWSGTWYLVRSGNTWQLDAPSFRV